MAHRQPPVQLKIPFCYSGNPTLYAQPASPAMFLWPIHGEDRQFVAGLAAIGIVSGSV